MIEKLKFSPAFVDARGEITNLLEEPIAHITLIDSRAGALRGNHFHQEDSHWTYLVSGKFEYSEMHDGVVETTVMEPGDMVFSPALVPHAMKFSEESVFFAFTTKERDAGKYDEDLHRFTVVEPEA
jgi:quercetin dioxygenase-like cupin family protein